MKHAFTMAGAGQGASLIGLRACGHTAFTMADRLSRLHNRLVDSRSAFTMAEILLSLTIIGVVAAITLPSLTGNINERTWNTQRKALYARFSQAIALMPALNGYGTLTEATSSASGVDTAAETFITEGLSKVLKINNICDSEHLEDCGFPLSIIRKNGTKTDTPTRMSLLNNDMTNMSYQVWHYSQIDTVAAAFETVNGESILTFYSPNCYSSSAEPYSQPTVCANFVYDLNGLKGPNTIGKDIGFITVLYPTDSSVVSPYLTQGADSTRRSHEESIKYCRNLDNESRLPNKEELVSLYVNRELIGNLGTGFFWSASSISNEKAYLINQTGQIHSGNKTSQYLSVCVKR